MISSYKNKKTATPSLIEAILRERYSSWYVAAGTCAPMKGGNRHIRGFDSLNCLKPYWLRNMIISVLFFLRVVYLGIVHWGIEDLIEQLTHIFMRLSFSLSAVFRSPHIILYSWKIFFINFFQIFLISSIYTKLSNHGDFTWGYILGLLGFGFYIFILLNKYITFRDLYIWAIKILKKSKKVVKLDCFRLYNILGS